MTTDAIETRAEQEPSRAEAAPLQVHVHIHLGNSAGDLRSERALPPSTADRDSGRRRSWRPVTTAAVLCGVMLAVGWLATRPVGGAMGNIVPEKTAAARPANFAGPAPYVPPPVPAREASAIGPSPAGPPPSTAKSGPGAFGLSD